MTGFILIGLALMLGNTLPASIQLLMLIGGVASFVAPGVSGSGQQRLRCQLSLSGARGRAGR